VFLSQATTRYLCQPAQISLPSHPRSGPAESPRPAGRDCRPGPRTRATRQTNTPWHAAAWVRVAAYQACLQHLRSTADTQVCHTSSVSSCKVLLASAKCQGSNRSQIEYSSVQRGPCRARVLSLTVRNVGPFRRARDEPPKSWRLPDLHLSHVSNYPTAPTHMTQDSSRAQKS
jgi:hypothetical protein